MISRRALVVSAILCLAGYAWVYANGLAQAPIRSDGFSYYVYLPSWFLSGTRRWPRLHATAAAESSLSSRRSFVGRAPGAG